MCQDRVDKACMGSDMYSAGSLELLGVPLSGRCSFERLKTRLSHFFVSF